MYQTEDSRLQAPWLNHLCLGRGLEHEAQDNLSTPKRTIQHLENDRQETQAYMLPEAATWIMLKDSKVRPSNFGFWSWSSGVLVFVLF